MTEGKIRLEIEITEREAALLAGWRIPEELCGSGLEARIRFLIDDYCQGLERFQQEGKSKQLYRLFNMRHPDDHDDVMPF